MHKRALMGRGHRAKGKMLRGSVVSDREGVGVEGGGRGADSLCNRH